MIVAPDGIIITSAFLSLWYTVVLCGLVLGIFASELFKSLTRK